MIDAPLLISNLHRYKFLCGDFKRRVMNKIGDDPELAIAWSMEIDAPFPAGEPAIAKDAECSYTYAHDILKGPFSLGEETLAKSAMYATYYAVDILKGPFPLAEDLIRRSSHAIMYAVHDLHMNEAEVWDWQL